MKIDNKGDEQTVKLGAARDLDCFLGRRTPHGQRYIIDFNLVNDANCACFIANCNLRIEAIGIYALFSPNLTTVYPGASRGTITAFVEREGESLDLRENPFKNKSYMNSIVYIVGAVVIVVVVLKVLGIF